MKLPWGASKTITIGGRRWRLIGPTSVLHDTKTAALAQEMGFFDRPAAGEEESDFLGRVAERLNASGRLVELLGYVVLPADRTMDDWTPELAAETSETLGRLTAPRDKEKILPLLQQAVLHFFLLAKKFSEVSRSSSIRTAAVADLGRGILELARASTATGRASSTSSPGGTPPGAGTSPGGPSVMH